MAVIGIDKGHTKQDGGCCGACGMLKESVENRLVGDKVIQKLKAKGHIVVDCSCDYATNQGDQLYNIVKKANAQNLDLFFSLHLNAYNGIAFGAEIITTTTTSQSSKEHADRIVDNYCEKLGFTNRGLKFNNDLYVLRKTSAKAMLLEMCFVDNQGDVNRWNKLGYDTIADVIVEGILDEISNDNFISAEPSKPVGNPVQKPVINNTSKLGSYEYAKDYANKSLDIKDIQKKLDYLGFSMSPYGADGSFGNLTFQRVKEFQQKNNLNVDGCIGLNSIAKLNQLYNAKVEANKPKPQTSNKYLPYDLAKRLQTALKSQGFTDINGQPLSIDGDAKEKTAYALARNNFHYRTPVMNGAITKLVQEILSYRGYKVDIDGFFGKDCDSKLRAFQKANGLLVDGNLGLNTAKKLLGL